MELSRRIQWIRGLSVAVVALTFAVMVMGAWVKATGSGLSCPDWPKCYGQWWPPFPSLDSGGVDPATGEPVFYTHAQVLYEWWHRLLAVLLGPLVLSWWALALWGRGLHAGLRLLPSAAVPILLFQGVLGGITVLGKNQAYLTTFHLGTATLFFFLVTVSAAFAFLRPLQSEPVGQDGGRVSAPVGFPGEDLHG